MSSQSEATSIPGPKTFPPQQLALVVQHTQLTRHVAELQQQLQIYSTEALSAFTAACSNGIEVSLDSSNNLASAVRYRKYITDLVAYVNEAHDILQSTHSTIRRDLESVQQHEYILTILNNLEKDLPSLSSILPWTQFDQRREQEFDDGLLMVSQTPMKKQLSITAQLSSPMASTKTHISSLTVISPSFRRNNSPPRPSEPSMTNSNTTNISKITQMMKKDGEKTWKKYLPGFKAVLGAVALSYAAFGRDANTELQRYDDLARHLEVTSATTTVAAVGIEMNSNGVNNASMSYATPQIVRKIDYSADQQCPAHFQSTTLMAKINNAAMCKAFASPSIAMLSPQAVDYLKNSIINYQMEQVVKSPAVSFLTPKLQTAVVVVARPLSAFDELDFPEQLLPQQSFHDEPDFDDDDFSTPKIPQHHHQFAQSLTHSQQHQEDTMASNQAANFVPVTPAMMLAAPTTPVRDIQSHTRPITPIMNQVEQHDIPVLIEKDDDIMMLNSLTLQDDIGMITTVLDDVVIPTTPPPRQAPLVPGQTSKKVKPSTVDRSVLNQLTALNSIRQQDHFTYETQSFSLNDHHEFSLYDNEDDAQPTDVKTLVHIDVELEHVEQQSIPQLDQHTMLYDNHELNVKLSLPQDFSELSYDNPLDTGAAHLIHNFNNAVQYTSQYVTEQGIMMREYMNEQGVMMREYINDQGTMVTEYVTQQTNGISDYVTEQTNAVTDYVTEQTNVVADYVTEQGTFVKDYVTEQGTFVKDYVTEQGTIVANYVTEQGTIATNYVTEQGTIVKDYVAEHPMTQYITEQSITATNVVSNQVNGAVEYTSQLMQDAQKVYEAQHGEVMKVANAHAITAIRSTTAVITATIDTSNVVINAAVESGNAVVKSVVDTHEAVVKSVVDTHEAVVNAMVESRDNMLKVAAVSRDAVINAAVESRDAMVEIVTNTASDSREAVIDIATKLANPDTTSHNHDEVQVEATLGLIAATTAVAAVLVVEEVKEFKKKRAAKRMIGKPTQQDIDMASNTRSTRSATRAAAAAAAAATAVPVVVEVVAPITNTTTTTIEVEVSQVIAPQEQPQPQQQDELQPLRRSTRLARSSARAEEPVMMTTTRRTTRSTTANRKSAQTITEVEAPAPQSPTITTSKRSTGPKPTPVVISQDIAVDSSLVDPFEDMNAGIAPVEVVTPAAKVSRKVITRRSINTAVSKATKTKSSLNNVDDASLDVPLAVVTTVTPTRRYATRRAVKAGDAHME